MMWTNTFVLFCDETILEKLELRMPKILQVTNLPMSSEKLLNEVRLELVAFLTLFVDFGKTVERVISID